MLGNPYVNLLTAINNLTETIGYCWTDTYKYIFKAFILFISPKTYIFYLTNM